MKFFIIAFYPQIMVPYSFQYEKMIQSEGGDYDILFWDRFNTGPLEKRSNMYFFHRKCSLRGKRLKKIYPLYLFRKTVNKIIREGSYDKIIVLTTLPGILICNTLLKRYSGNFILDIRDYTYEKYVFYYAIEKKLINASYCTVISSRGFKQFLGENDKIIINHNISNEKTIVEKSSLQDNNEFIYIGFIGLIRYYEENVKLIDSLVKNKKYRLFYAGDESDGCNLREYCANKGYKHVLFSGEFKNSDKPSLYQRVDLINALYGCGSLEVTTAIPNRLYDCLIFKKPIIVTAGTYLAKIVKKYKLGVVLSPMDNYERKITEYITCFDEKCFITNANRLLEIVMKEQDNFYRKIQCFINSEE